MKVIPYGRQNITEKDIEAVTNILNSDYLTQGPAIGEFEKNFAKYIGSEYAVAVSNGTAALHLSALALNISQGQKVITSPITFAASSNAVLYCGGQVEFADIDPNTYTLDIEKVRVLLEADPKGYSGVIPVDFTGYPVNLEAFKKLADEFNLWILEDACHAPGASFIDSKGVSHNSGSGKFADLSIFSFHPVKHIASGEGGMITTNRKDLYDELMKLRTHGITKDPNLLNENHGGWYYEMQSLGYNYRLTDIQAALGNSQLERADVGVAKRIEIAETYDNAFRSYGIVRQTRNPESQNAYHLYVIEVEDRLGLYNHLRAKGVFAQVHYIPVHYQPYYKKMGWKKGDFPISEAYYERCLSLPMYPTLSSEDQQFVIDQVIDFLN